nr:MAG TPA: hypothetical protein [Caudoviricetes sp.]
MQIKIIFIILQLFYGSYVMCMREEGDYRGS